MNVSVFNSSVNYHAGDDDDQSVALRPGLASRFHHDTAKKMRAFFSTNNLFLNHSIKNKIATKATKTPLITRVGKVKLRYLMAIVVMMNRYITSSYI